MNIVVAGFADELKDTCYRLYSWTGLKHKEYYEQFPLEKETLLPALNMTVRDLWIKFGNHCRQYDSGIWVKALLTKPQVDVMIIKDMRFPNEVACVKQLNGHCIKVNRPSQIKQNDGADDPLEDYANWDHVVDNLGTLNDLNDHAQNLIGLFKLDQI